MKRLFEQDQPIVEKRYLLGSLVITLITCGLLTRLWYVQIYKGDFYTKISQRNRIRRIEIPAPRGKIYDRHGELILGNRPYFDLVFIPQFVKDKETTFQILSKLLNSSSEQFEKRLRKGWGRPKFLPITLKKNLSLHELSIIESNKVLLPGIEVRVAPRREYPEKIPPHLIGYLREIDSKSLKRLNKLNKNSPYYQGDLIGKQGIEAKYEKYLRGRRGYELIQVDAYGRQTSSLNDWNFPKEPAEPGADIILTLDWELQKAVTSYFSGKQGAIVVLNPNNGEILAAVSAPGFNPKTMQTGISFDEWRRLTQNPFKPFLDKTTGGEFPPGSIYKPVVAMAALEEGIITPNTSFNCPGHFTLGKETFYCHNRGGHGKVDLRKAMMNSCDTYFYHIGVELGVDKIAKYAHSLGLGKRLGVSLNMERPGLVPTSEWKKLVHKQKWTAGDTPNISIGQGYNLLTPMQMANLYSTIANNGKTWKPRIVKRITNHIGETIMEDAPALIEREKIISDENLELMRNILKDVVMDPKGTGKKAAVAGHTVAGKTGSVQVVSLKKNRNQTDVSIKWKEHAIFGAFSPVKNAEIAIAIVSQNDSIGGGGRAAAPIAGKIIKKYWELKEKRTKVRARSELAKMKREKENVLK